MAPVIFILIVAAGYYFYKENFIVPIKEMERRQDPENKRQGITIPMFEAANSNNLRKQLQQVRRWKATTLTVVIICILVLASTCRLALG